MAHNGLSKLGHNNIESLTLHQEDHMRTEVTSTPLSFSKSNLNFQGSSDEFVESVPKAIVLATVLEKELYVQTFDLRLETKVWFLHGEETEHASSSTLIEHDTSIGRLLPNDESESIVAAALSHRGSFLVASISNGAVVGCMLQTHGEFAAYHAAESETFSSLLELPYPAESLNISSDGELMVVDFGQNNKDHPNIAGMVVAVVKQQIPGGSSHSWKLRFEVLRHLNHLYVNAVPGTLRFQDDNPREMLCAWSHEMGQIQVGVLKLAHSEVVQQVEGRLDSHELKYVQRGAWTLDGQAVALVGDAVQLFLFAPFWLEAHSPWHHTVLDHPIDFLQWERSSLVLVVASVEEGIVTLLDRVLQPLVRVNANFPDHILDATQVFSCLWAHEGQHSLAQARREEASDIEVFCVPSNAKYMDEPTACFRCQSHYAEAMENDFLEAQSESALAIVCHDGTPITVLFPTSLNISRWRSIIACHLLQDIGSESLTLKTRMRYATRFALALGEPTDRRFRALRLMSRELSKAAQCELVISTQDQLHAWLLDVLDGLSTATRAVQDPRLQERWIALLEASQRRYIADRLRLGQLERACQFTYRLVDRGPVTKRTVHLAASLFQQIAAWAERFGQGQSIGGIARNAAQRLYNIEMTSALESELHLQSNELSSTTSSSFSPALSSPGSLQTMSPSQTTNSHNADSFIESESSSTLSPFSPNSSLGSRASVRMGKSRQGSSNSTEVGISLKEIYEMSSGKDLKPKQRSGDLEVNFSAADAAEEISLIWREWRCSEAARQGTSAISGSLSPLSLESEDLNEDLQRQKAHGKGAYTKALTDENGLLSTSHARQLALWLECRGKFSQAIDVCVRHGLEREAQRLQRLRQHIDHDGPIRRIKRL
mmetsp:Transcript_154/g.433  ORF Transcript_154/g.433 Transcript_154/m.433 type:complete len:887 (+) Transcript_154:150-2810(+)